MNISTFTPMARPFFRVSGESGQGCPCGCSPGYWISVSDGKIGLRMSFTNKAEYRAALDGELHTKDNLEKATADRVKADDWIHKEKS